MPSSIGSARAINAAGALGCSRQGSVTETSRRLSGAHLIAPRLGRQRSDLDLIWSWEGCDASLQPGLTQTNQRGTAHSTAQLSTEPSPGSSPSSVLQRPHASSRCSCRRVPTPATPATAVDVAQLWSSFSREPASRKVGWGRSRARNDTWQRCQHATLHCQKRDTTARGRATGAPEKRATRHLGRERETRHLLKAI